MKRIKVLSAFFIAFVALVVPVTAQAASSYSIQDYPVDAYLTSEEMSPSNVRECASLTDFSEYIIDSPVDADKPIGLSIAALTLSYHPLRPSSTQVPQRAQQRQNLYKFTFEAGKVYTIRYSGVAATSPEALDLHSRDTTAPLTFMGNERLYFYDTNGRIVNPAELTGTIDESGINIWLPAEKTVTYYIGCSSANACDVTQPYAVFKDVGDYRLVIHRTSGAVVYFNSQGGTEVPTQILTTLPAKIVEPQNPTRAGKAFGGWYKEPACTTKWNFESDPAVTTQNGKGQQITLYAKWTDLPKYTVSCIALGSVCASQTVFQGDLATKPANPTRSGYTFKGWYTSDTYEAAWNFATQKVTKDTELFAKWASDNSYLTTIRKSTGTWSRTMPFKKAGGSMRLNVSSSKSTLTLEPIKSSSKAKRYIKIGSGKYYRIAKVTMRVKKGSVKTVTMKVVSESGKTRYYKIYVTRR